MNAVIIPKVAHWVLALIRHVLIYVSFALQDDATIHEEHNREENGINCELIIEFVRHSLLTSLAKILSALNRIGSMSMKLKRSMMATEIEPIWICELIPSSVAIWCLEKNMPAHSMKTAPN